MATERFAADGYEQTRVADIVRTLGITPQVFYNHFPSKLQLLVESFNTFISWNLAYVEPEAAESSDPGERLLRRLAADYRTSEFGADVMSRIRSEPSDDRADKLKLAERAWDGIARQIQTDFETAVPPGSPPPPIPLELLAHSMIGAQHNASARASWDQRFSRADVLRTHLWLWSAVTAALSGNTGIRDQVARYEGLIREIAAREPENPPPIAD